MKLLLNISNHTSDKWSDKQKEGWDKIKDIPFPQIDPYKSIIHIHTLAEDYLKEILDTIQFEIDSIEDKDIFTECPIETYIMLQGEYTFCYLLRDMIKDNYIFVIPTTERKTVEKVKEDGIVEKTSVFEFVQWRKI